MSATTLAQPGNIFEPPQQRREDVDVLRGFAILAVLLLHVAVLTPGLDQYPGIVPFVERLSTGIQLFFVLSGYLIACSMDRCLASGEGVPGFLVRRAAKLVPLYLIFLHLHIALFLLMREVAPELPQPRNSVSVESLRASNYLLHLFFLQGFVPAWLHTLLDGSWSIVVEAYFYLIFAALPAAATRTPAAAAKLYAASLALAIGFVVVVGRSYSGYSHYGFAAQLPCFMLGVIAQRVMATPAFETRFAPYRIPVVAAAVLLMLGLIKGQSRPLGDSNIYALCFAAVLLASPAVAAALPIIVRRVVANFGRQSYALYFVHLVLLKAWYVAACAWDLAPSFAAALAVNLVIALPLSWLASAILFDPIDRFFVARADRWLARRHRKLPNRSTA